MKNADAIPCGLCGRPFVRDGLTRHHCLPRQKGGTAEDVELLCGQCHSMVHATFTNHTLAAVYPSLTELRKAPELAEVHPLGSQAALQPAHAQRAATAQNLTRRSGFPA